MVILPCHRLVYFSFLRHEPIEETQAYAKYGAYKVGHDHIYWSISCFIKFSIFVSTLYHSTFQFQATKYLIKFNFSTSQLPIKEVCQ